MAKVVRVEVEEGGYCFTFSARFRSTDSVEPKLVGIADLKANVLDPGKDIPRETKRRAYALAAVVFNKFKR